VVLAALGLTGPALAAGFAAPAGLAPACVLVALATAADAGCPPATATASVTSVMPSKAAHLGPPPRSRVLTISITASNPRVKTSTDPSAERRLTQYMEEVGQLAE